MKLRNLLFIFVVTTLIGGCVTTTSIALLEDEKIEVLEIREDVILFNRQFIAKGTKFRVRSFKNGVRAVSLSIANHAGGGVLVVGGLPVFVPVSNTDELLVEIDTANCVTGKRVFVTMFRVWAIGDTPSVTPEVLKPNTVCFDARPQ
jgi:hypothetical protein